MNKVMDFSGSGVLLMDILHGDVFMERLWSLVHDRKVCCVIMLEDDMPTIGPQPQDEPMTEEEQELPAVEFEGESFASLDGRNEPDNDGWIEWAGCPLLPLNAAMQVEVKFRNGKIFSTFARELEWTHSGEGYDIVAYRVVKP